MNPKNHRDVYYSDDVEKACKMVNDPRFQKLTEYPSLFEVQFAKKKIVMNQNLPVAHTILQVIVSHCHICLNSLNHWNFYL